MKRFFLERVDITSASRDSVAKGSEGKHETYVALVIKFSHFFKVLVE